MKTTISLATLALVNNISAVDINRYAIPDGYTFNHDNLENSIKATHTNAEKLRTTAVADQEAADEWRKGKTPNASPVLSLSQAREGPYYGSSLTNATFKSYDVDAGHGDSYEDNFHNLREALKAQQDAHNVRRAALVQVREPYYGSSLTNATLKSYDVDAGNGDAYETNFHNLRSDLRAKQDAHLYDQQAKVADQEDADSWRKGSTPNSSPVVSLVQEPYYGSSLTNATLKSYDVDAGNGDAYETNFHNLRSDLRAKQDAHLYDQQAKVADQEDADSWRKGSTPNSSPVVLNQRRAVLALSQAREPYYGSSLTNATMKSYDVDAGMGGAYETHFHN